MKPIDLASFGKPWEHVRLLSDSARNTAMLQVMARHCPGNRVLEVGCGTGLLSVIAAKMGATKVYAVEPTAVVNQARELVARNGLEGIVEVHEALIEDLEPREVDFAFSELLNADPFAEGVMEAMFHAKRWVVPGGSMTPKRLKVFAGLVREADSAWEVKTARKQVASFAKRYELDLSTLDGVLAEPGSYTYVHHVRDLIGPAVCLWDLIPGEDEAPEDPMEVSLVADEAGPVGGVAVWFEATMDDGILMHNRPGKDSHWGQLVSGWPHEHGVTEGERVWIQANVDEDGMVVDRLDR